MVFYTVNGYIGNILFICNLCCLRRFEKELLPACHDKFGHLGMDKTLSVATREILLAENE